MKPYRVPDSRAPSAEQPSPLGYGRLEQLCIYVLLAIAAGAIAFAEIKIP